MSADMGTEVELSLTVPERELRTARKTIQDGIGDVQVGVQTGTGAASRATGGGGAGGAGGRMQRRTFRWARQRTEHLQDTVMLLDEIAQSVTSGGGLGGGGGGGGGLLGGAAARMGGGALGGGVSSLIGGVSASAVIQKVSLKSLLKKAPAFATLVTAADLSTELIEGELSADDLISAPIELGDKLTFGAVDNEAIEGAIGTVTLAIGTYQIGSLISGKVAGSALAGYFGSVSIGSILGGIGTGATSLTGLLTASGAAPIAALVGGTVSLADLIDGDISDWNLPAKFGKALGEEVEENFPDLADTIETQMTENNPFFQAGRDFKDWWDSNIKVGDPDKAPEDGGEGPLGPGWKIGTDRTGLVGAATAAPGFDPTSTPTGTPDFDVPQNTQGDLAPGQIGRRDGELVVGQQGGGVERAVNINVQNQNDIVVEASEFDREFEQKLERAGVSPDEIQRIKREIEQIRRGSG